jgi:hypothetical protein
MMVYCLCPCSKRNRLYSQRVAFMCTYDGWCLPSKFRGDSGEPGVSTSNWVQAWVVYCPLGGNQYFGSIKDFVRGDSLAMWCDNPATVSVCSTRRDRDPTLNAIVSYFRRNMTATSNTITSTAATTSPQICCPGGTLLQLLWLGYTRSSTTCLSGITLPQIPIVPTLVHGHLRVRL